MNIEHLQEVASRLVAPGKGILAADESTGTIQKRMGSAGVDSTEDSRRDYREMLFRTTKSFQDHISGVILYDETIRQRAKDGTPLVKLIENAGAVPGIKVDRGTVPLALADGETATEGLDGLRERFQEYYTLGARFAKWRAVIRIGSVGDREIPSERCIRANAHALARYAALSQEQSLVPIVEPEVLMDGGHDIDRCAAVTESTLRTVFEELALHGVHLEGLLLKPNMIISGKESQKRDAPGTIARMTIACFRRVVPAAVPGIVFLSGGQSEVQATANLNAINETATGVPWRLTFSFGRALQDAPMRVWRGVDENEPAAQQAFLHRTHMNSLAQKGVWSESSESVASR